MSYDVMVDASNRWFVIPAGEGSSRLGFDEAFNRLREYARLLRLASPREDEIGTMKQYRDLCYTERAYAASKPRGMLFGYDTPAAVRRVLEECCASKARVRLFFGDPETGRRWLEEDDVLGRVSATRGPIKLPLLLLSSCPSDGIAISDRNILRITRVRDGVDLYRSPLFQVPNVEVVRGAKGHSGWTVLYEGEPCVTFVTEGPARRLAALLSGNRISR